ncbi:uncharacterized protein At1g04910-like [Carica papaya]|uniref:uncharacterized protein At1g04910-like n=1 Tax=Carica papaya TaxID=3649 RepID=UPI000B8D186E|nr:uncharacterized protein At1g04910-like [Carica papaya]
MKVQYQSFVFQTQRRGALAGLFLILFPVFLPCLFTPFSHASPSLFSEWNTPKPRHLPLLKSALHRQSSDSEQSDLWMPLADQGWRPFVQSKDASSVPEKSEGYLQVFLDGGLNQQRMGICDAVAVAKILNATLVIPYLEVNPVWQDSSSFVDIFDVDHFVNVLKDDISIVKELPAEFSWSTREYYATAIRATRIKTAPVHASANWYLENVLPVLQRLIFFPYSFVFPVLNSQFTDEELRSQGRCPLTPEEIGLLLAALGFDNCTRLYLASHKVYGGEARISTLRKLFPLMEDKKSLASSEERARIKGKASLLAAVDYYVGMHSDIFVSASPGNMHNALVGHRTYENLKTIRPNMALSGQLFLNKSITWSEFQRAVVEGHESRQGLIRLRKPKQSLYTYPAPDCMCGV